MSIFKLSFNCSIKIKVTYIPTYFISTILTFNFTNFTNNLQIIKICIPSRWVIIIYFSRHNADVFSDIFSVNQTIRDRIVLARKCVTRDVEHRRSAKRRFDRSFAISLLFSALTGKTIEKKLCVFLARIVSSELFLAILFLRFSRSLRDNYFLQTLFLKLKRKT